MQKVVVSKSLEGQKLKNASIIGDNLREEITKLKEANGKEIIMFGSPGTLHSLMRLDLIDECWIFINPILLGHGIPLFKNITHQIKLALISSKVFTSGVVCLHYERVAMA